MIATAMDVLEHYQVRKTAKQKQSFREAVVSYCRDLGYPVNIEKGSLGAQNVIIGDPATAQYLVTAHYDTPATMPFPNFITPCNFAVYLLYQLLIVGLVFGICGLIAWAAFALTNDGQITFSIAYLSYWVVFLLMMLGPANKNNANDNTSGIVTLLEIVRTMPESYRGKVCFVLFDLEEAGLVGSASYRKVHKRQTQVQIVLNLDCVGDGNEIVLFPNKKLKNDPVNMDKLRRISGNFGAKCLYIHEKGFSVCPSDHKNFPLGVGIMAFKRMRLIGIYCDRIHTIKDTNLDLTNVNILRAALTTLITGSAAQ